jgi:hypothetical protein
MSPLSRSLQIAAIGMGIVVMGLTAQAQESLSPNADLRSCDTIECVRVLLADTVKFTTNASISPGAEDRWASDAAWRKMQDAFQDAKRQVLADIASEQFFAVMADRVDQGIPLNDEIARYSRLDDGTEELLVVGGTEAEARLLLGTRAETTGVFQIVLHLAWSGNQRRAITVASGLQLSPHQVDGPDSGQDEAISRPSGAAASSPGPDTKPVVQCSAVVNSRDQVRMLCVCIYYVDSATTPIVKACFDSGWKD